jgi:hypothetical protein
MLVTRRKLALFLATLAALVLSITAASADDWKLTGSGVRVKTIAFVDINVYAISHYMKELPGEKSAKAIIDADVGKKFVWTLKRDLPQEKVQGAITDAFKMNGYSDQPKIDAYLAAFAGELKEGSNVTIEYDADAKKVKVTTSVGKASVDGVDFMKGVWSIWFGKIDQPKLTAALMSKL